MAFLYNSQVESVIICDLLSTVDEYGLFQAPTLAESDDSE